MTFQIKLDVYWRMMPLFIHICLIQICTIYSRNQVLKLKHCLTGSVQIGCHWIQQIIFLTSLPSHKSASCSTIHTSPEIHCLSYFIAFHLIFIWSQSEDTISYSGPSIPSKNRNYVKQAFCTLAFTLYVCDFDLAPCLGDSRHLEWDYNVSFAGWARS